MSFLVFFPTFLLENKLYLIKEAVHPGDSDVQPNQRTLSFPRERTEIEGRTRTRKAGGEGAAGISLPPRPGLTSSEDGHEASHPQMALPSEDLEAWVPPGPPHNSET